MVCEGKAVHMELDKFAILACARWQRRNSLRVNHEGESPDKVHCRAMDLLQEFHQANIRPSPSPTIPITPVRWSPPPNGIFKVNFDGAMFADQNTAGLGIIICNH
jgi:hypothetical protein